MGPILFLNKFLPNLQLSKRSFSFVPELLFSLKHLNTFIVCHKLLKMRTHTSEPKQDQTVFQVFSPTKCTFFGGKKTLVFIRRLNFRTWEQKKRKDYWFGKLLNFFPQNEKIFRNFWVHKQKNALQFLKF